MAASTPPRGLAVITIVGTAISLGLAILGWGGVAAFFAHPARVVLTVVLVVWSAPRCSAAAT